MVLVISSPAGEHLGRVLQGQEDFASDLAFQAPDDLGLARSHSRLPPHFRLGTAIMAKPDRYDAAGNRISIQRTTPPSTPHALTSMCSKPGTRLPKTGLGRM